MKKSLDARSAWTREAIVRSFNALVLRRGHDAMRVSDIANAAHVGRSTFYEHFRGKDELLSHAAAARLAVFADAAVGLSDTSCVAAMLVHMRENAQAVRSMLRGTAGVSVKQCLCDLIEVRLAAISAGRTPIIPLRLAALHIADSQLGAVLAWLRGAAPCEPLALAEFLVSTSRQAAACVYERPARR